MPSLKDIRLRIKSVKSTQKTTKAMKMVAAAKLRRAQDQITHLRPYANRLLALIGRLQANPEVLANHPLVEDRKEKKRLLLIIVTSNKGLCGAFNSAIIKEAERELRTTYAEFLQADKVDIVAVGRKGAEHFQRRGYRVLGGNRDLFTRLAYEEVEELAQELMDGYLSGTWDKVLLAYNEFKNVATQERRVITWLPLTPETKASDEQETTAGDVLFEPDRGTIINDLIPRVARTLFFRAVLDSNASEHGARMIAMDNATENAQELIDDLRLKFNKARQAAITKEILEIVSGAEALEQS